MTPGAKLVILGGGESGTGSALLAKSKGFEVFLSEKNSLQKKYRVALSDAGVAFEEGGHSEEEILTADLVIKSPGIPERTELIKKLRSLKKPLISEIEFAGRYTDARITAITGSNGKTTTTLLTHHLVSVGGLRAGLGGNIGESFARSILEEDFDHFVLELSSFQLDDIYDFRVNTAILLNITPDHLDRYDYSFTNYIHSKFRIVRNQTKDDYFIFNADDPVISAEVSARHLPATQLPVSLSRELPAGAFLADGRLYFRIPEQSEFRIPIDGLPIKGPHNHMNIMCAVLAALLENISPDDIISGLATFKNAPHRLEPVAVIDGVEYINDSKATNVDSVFYALQSFDSPVILILGGVDKGNDYNAIKALVTEKVKGIIALGKENSKISTFFEPLVPAFFATDSLNQAIMKARNWANPGEVVLLSPACASFDLFKNYEDRGDRFREAVLTLTSGVPHN